MLRVFVDADTCQVLAVAPYWDPAVMIPEGAVQLMIEDVERWSKAST